MTVNYLTHPLDRIWACDIEADSLTPTRVWCFTAVHAVSKKEVRLRHPSEIQAFIQARALRGEMFVFHNGVAYDGPNLNRLCGTNLSVNHIIDTLVLSMVYSPSLDGGHSLEAWGERLKYPKGEWNDWSQWSQEMEDYCLRDSHLCLRIYLELRRRMGEAKFTELGLELEHRSWALIKQQQKNGFAFNLEEAHILYSKLRDHENDVERRVHEFWPPELQCVFTGQKPFRKDGTPSANYQRHLEQYASVVLIDDGARYRCYSFVPFNIGSPSQRVKRLLELGWEPREFTKPSISHPQGQPQPFVKGNLAPSLAEFVSRTEHGGAKLIAEWIEYNARSNMINTWMEAYNHDTGCIHGSLWLANTLRYRHSNPNTANIPAVRVGKSGLPLMGEEGVYTYESRNLWCTRDRGSRLLVGTDAKGIQLRVLAHYLNNKDFIDAVLGGDPHSYNQEIGGFATRAVAKTFIYAFLLGAGDAKVGQIIGGSTRDGREVKARFTSNFPGLGNLLDDLARQVDRTGRIVLCDGTPVIVDRPHTRLGYLLQGDESRIMKKAAILVDQDVRRRKLDVLKVCDVHDEFQNDVLREHVQEFVGDVCPTAFARSGEFFNYRLPIHCSSSIGETWANTH